MNRNDSRKNGAAMQALKRTFAVLLLVGCGGSDAIGPTQTVQIGGSWLMDVTGVSGGTLQNCSLSPFAATLVQVGTTFNGSFGQTTLSCPGVGSAPITGGNIVNGSITGLSVSFDLNTPDLHQTGTIRSAVAMDGTVRYRLSDGTILTGGWAANKQ